MFVRSSLASAIAAGLSLVLAQAVPAYGTEVDATSPAAAAAPANAAKDGGKDEKKEQQELEAVQVTGRFIASGARSAMKQDLDVRDTPYSVADYSSSFMKAIETANLTDLYSYMTGVSRGGVTGYDISIRGFKTTQSDENAILIDGLPGLAGRFGSPPTVMAERIEVVKGPASVLYGEAQPGGFVNIVTKKPQDKAAGVIDVLATSYAGSGLSLGDTASFTGDLDLTGPIDNERRLLYRVVAESSDRDTFRGGWERSFYFAPSVTWRVSDATSLRLSAEYRKRTNAYDNLLVAPNKDARLIAPITTRYQEPGDVQQETGRSVTAALEHEFDNEGVWNLAARSVRGSDTAVGYDNVAVLADLVTLQRRARSQQNHRQYDYVDTNYSMPFKTGFIEHKLLVGGGGGTNRTDFNRIQFYNGATTGALAKPGPKSLNINIYNPIFGISPPLSSFPAGTVNDRITTETNVGAYLSDVMTLSEHWKASFGLRYTRDEQNGKEVKTPPLTSSSKADSDLLPTAGILYQPNAHWTFYYSSATSFIAAAPTAQDIYGNNPFKPTTAKQNEAGIKADLFDGRINTTFAVFDIQKSNTLAVATCNVGVPGTCSQQVGGEESKGFEWEVDAHLSENWQVLFGYAHADATVTKSNGAKTSPLVGSRLTNAPLDSAHIWSRYDFSEGTLRNFGIGAGVTYVSEIAGSQPSLGDSRVLVLPGHVVADLVLYYQLLDKYTVTLKVGNVFGKTYFEGVNSTTNEVGVVPGAPRTIQLAVRVPFL
ncbi:MAG: TonB-dependent siderophore receptor [Rudaea sp.]|nr:TonB-dependent siderophore receptor [Rudaea sp.]